MAGKEVVAEQVVTLKNSLEPLQKTEDKQVKWEVIPLQHSKAPDWVFSLLNLMVKSVEKTDT